MDKRNYSQLLFSMILMACTALSTLAQQDLWEVLDPNQLNSKLLSATKRNFEGNPYLFDTWMSGNVTVNTGQTIPTEQMNYDCISDQVIIKNQETGQELAVFKKLVESFEINDGNILHSFKRMILPGEIKYVEVILEGKLDLLKFHRKEVIEKKAASGYSTTAQSSSQVRYKAEYFLHNHDELFAVPFKENVSEIFGNKTDIMTSYMKSERIKLKSKIKFGKLVKLVNYYNSL